ncbi:MAG TPA: hypothetical protein VIH00_02555 [Candidatus Limnocylindrales bacterium]
MRRIIGIAGAMLIVLFTMVPAVLAAEMPHDGWVLWSTGGDVSVAAGEHADAVIVIDGTATIAGEVNSLIVVSGRAELTGATVESLVAISSQVDIGAGTTVLGDVRYLDSTVTQAPDAQVTGRVSDLTGDFAVFGAVLVSAFFLLWVGFVLAAVVAALVLAALAARQVRAAETIISREPGVALVAGIAGTFLPILLIVALFVTVVGAPLGFAILFGVWPFLAFVGYLVAAIWVGDWILARTSPGVHRERPYLASVIGMVVLGVLNIVPFVAMLATLFGYGAVLVLAWRIFRAPTVGATAAPAATPAPMPS